MRKHHERSSKEFTFCKDDEVMIHYEHNNTICMKGFLGRNWLSRDQLLFLLVQDSQTYELGKL